MTDDLSRPLDGGPPGASSNAGEVGPGGARRRLSAAGAAAGAACVVAVVFLVVSPQRSGGNATAPAATAHVSAVDAAGMLEHPLTYPSMGIELAPPAPGATARVSPQAAYASCRTGAVCGDGKPSRVVLASVTTANGATIGTDGAVEPTTVDRLAYVLTWDAMTCAPSGPPGSSHLVAGCLFVTLVDADTGAYLGASSTTSPGG